MWEWLDSSQLKADPKAETRSMCAGAAETWMYMHQDRRRRIDYIFMNTSWDVVGVAKEWHTRFGHRPLLA